VLVISIQIEDVLLLKTTGEVPAGGRVRNALSAQSIEEGLIIAPQLNILQPHSLEQRVVGQIQHMVALVVGQVFLKQMQPRVDLLPQPQFVDHQMDRPDASAVDRLGFLGHLIMNIAGLHDRLGLIAPATLRVQTTLNSQLAIAQDLRIASLHSKWPFSWDGFGLVTAIKPSI
jgi:hypothetical protein